MTLPFAELRHKPIVYQMSSEWIMIGSIYFQKKISVCISLPGEFTQWSNARTRLTSARTPLQWSDAVIDQHNHLVSTNAVLRGKCAYSFKGSIHAHNAFRILDGFGEEITKCCGSSVFSTQWPFPIEKIFFATRDQGPSIRRWESITIPLICCYFCTLAKVQNEDLSRKISK